MAGSGSRLKKNEKSSCRRKRRYEAARTAREAADWSSFEFGQPMVPYFCRWCQGFHIARAETIVNGLRLKYVRRAMGAQNV